MSICLLYNNTGPNYRKCVELEKDIIRTAEEFREQEAAKFSKINNALQNLTKICRKCEQQEEAPSSNNDSYLSRAWKCITAPFECYYSDPAAFVVSIVIPVTLTITYLALRRPALLGNGDQYGGGGYIARDYEPLRISSGGGLPRANEDDMVNAAMTAHRSRTLGGSLVTPAVQEAPVAVLRAQQDERVGIVGRFQEVRWAESARQIGMIGELESMSARLAEREREAARAAESLARPRTHEEATQTVTRTGQQQRRNDGEDGLSAATEELERELRLREEQRRTEAARRARILQPAQNQAARNENAVREQRRAWVGNRQDRSPSVSRKADEAREKGNLGPYSSRKEWPPTLRQPPGNRHEEF